MNRQEFLNTLEECLDGQIEQAEIIDTLNYYKGYFLEEEQGGKTEEEVIRSLGSPRLIAHSILDAHEEAVTGSAEGYYDAENQTYEDDDQESFSDKVKPYIIKAVIIAVIVLLIVLGIFVLNVLLPFILLAVVIGWIYKKFINQ